MQHACVCLEPLRIIPKSSPIIYYITYNRAHGGSLGASADQTAPVSFSAPPGQTVSNGVKAF